MNNRILFYCWAHLQPAKVLHLLLSAFLFTAQYLEFLEVKNSDLEMKHFSFEDCRLFLVHGIVNGVERGGRRFTLHSQE